MRRGLVVTRTIHVVNMGSGGDVSTRWPRMARQNNRFKDTYSLEQDPLVFGAEETEASGAMDDEIDSVGIA